jgi:hypothetical protein
MKYTILGFQQEKLIKANLTVEDAFLLRMIKDMYSSASMEFLEHEQSKYMWINYSYLLEQLPIMGSKRNIMRKIERYGNELYILRLLKHSRRGNKGNFSYICPTIKLDELQDFDLMTESHKGYDKIDIRVMTESHNKDSSIRDTSIKDNKDILSDIEEIRSNYKGTKTKAEAYKKLPKLIKLYSKEELIQAITNYNKHVEKERNNGFKDLKYMNESTFWNGRYMDYLDENFEKEVNNNGQDFEEILSRNENRTYTYEEGDDII